MKLLFNLASHAIPTQATTRLDLQDMVRRETSLSQKDRRALTDVRSAAQAESRRQNAGEGLPEAGGARGRRDVRSRSLGSAHAHTVSFSKRWLSYFVSFDPDKDDHVVGSWASSL